MGEGRERSTHVRHGEQRRPRGQESWPPASRLGPADWKPVIADRKQNWASCTEGKLGQTPKIQKCHRRAVLGRWLRLKVQFTLRGKLFLPSLHHSSALPLESANVSRRETDIWVLSRRLIELRGGAVGGVHQRCTDALSAALYKCLGLAHGSLGGGGESLHPITWWGQMFY